MTRYIKCGFVRQTIMKERLIGSLLFLIVMCSGAVSTAMAGVHVKGNVYGGGNKASVGKTGESTTAAVNITNTNTKVDGEVYGGCNSQGSVIGKAIVTIKSGTVGTAPGEGGSIKNVVFGGGKGKLTLIEGDVEVNIGAVGQSQTPATINGSVYGGSALGNVNAYKAGSPAVVTPVSGAKTDVNIIFGTVLGDVYGGGLGDKASLGDGHADVAANVYGAVTVNVGATDGAATPPYSGSATLQSSVYGCNNLNGSPKDDVTVNIYQTAHTPTNLATYTANDATYAIDQVFGGGNQAHYAPTDVINKRALVHIFTCANTVKTVYGGGNAANATKVGIIIDGGRFDRVFGGGNGFSATGNHTDPDAPNYNPGANISGSATTQIHGGYYNKVFGGSNQFGDVANASLSLDTESSCEELFVSESFGGANEAVITGNVTTTLTCNSATGSFSIGSFYGGSNLANITGDVTLNVEGGTYINVFGGSKGAAGKAANIDGNVTLNLFGGTMDNAFGGSDVNGDITGKITVNMLNRGGDCPLVVHNIYGGGRDAAYTPTYTVDEGELHISPEVNLIHGTVSKKGDGTGGNVFGGGLGATAIVSANTKVTVGYNTSMAALVTSLLPDATSLTTANVVVQGDVYGGGEQAAVTGNTDVTVQQGTAEGMTISTAVNGAVYGGGALANVGTDASNSTQVTVTGGTVSDVYGGGLGRAAVAAVADDPETPDVDESAAAVEGIEARVNGAVTVNINGGSVTNVFGCNNINGAPQSTVQVNIEQTAATMSVTDVFGGGNLAQYAGSPVVNIKKGTVSGNVYGGGNGDPEDATQLKGATAAPTVTVGDLVNGAYQAIVSGDVYGGGNAAKVTGETAPTVVVQKCNTQVGYVYGGGNAADVPATNVTISGGTIAHDVYGGGHGDKASLNVDENDHTHSDKAANVTGNVSVSVTGGTIDKVFAGSNLNGSILGSVTLGIDKSTEGGACDMKIAEVYGGGNQAAGNAGTITIGCTGTWTEDDNDNDENNNFHNKHNTTDNRIGYELEGIGTVYGGANQANVGSNIELNITGGIVENVFGGNNTSGTIDGDITVNVEWGSASCSNYLGHVYGGGNLAAYSQKTAGHPAVNIKNGTVSQSVYGGGKGASAIVTGNPIVTIGDDNPSHYAIVTGDVYGGGDAAAVTGNTSVIYNDSHASSTVGKLFGGGNAAGVSGTATVTMTNGQVTAGVYGGCNAQGSVGDVTIALNGGAVGASGSGNEADVYGGGLGAATTTTGNIVVTLSGTTVYGDLYGGSALGSVNGSTSNTATLNINSNTLHGSIYGGGKGDVAGEEGHSNVTATSNGGVIINYNTAITDLAGLYGGANINGLVSGNIAVNVLANVGAAAVGTPGDPSYVAEQRIDIFGGGYGANTNTGGNVTVTIGNAATALAADTPTIYGDLYGGSALGNVNDAADDVTQIDFLNGTLHGNIYGGGLGDAGHAAKVNGKVVVNISNSEQSAANCHIDLRGVSIYGCNNTNGSPQDDVEVHIYQTAYNFSDYTEGNKYKWDYAPGGGDPDPAYAIDQVFGGGNRANYAPEDGLSSSTKKAKVYIHGCNNTIRRVFGGGNAAAATGVFTEIDGGRFANVFGGGNGEVTAADIGLGGTDLRVHGGKVTQLFGGSNTQGTIIGNMGISVDATGACASDMYVDEFFCGNNLANIGTSENPVNIDATIGCGTSFGDIYGGCNLADIYGNVELTIEGGIMNNVYGGSKGRVADSSDPSNPIAAEDADITGNVTLNIYGGNIRENAYGGSNVNGNITGSITVNMDWSQASSDCNSESDLHVGNIYGGSNLAAYTPTYTVGEGETRISPAVNIMHGTVSQSVFGGGKGATAIVTSNPVVTIGDDVEEHSTIVVGNVYGGGDAAAVTGNAKVIYNDNNASSTVANLFGGGNAAGVSGTTTVTMTSGKVTAGIYGGCNASGSVGDATLAINGGTLGTSDTPLTSGIFGGGFGNNTTTTGNITVTVNGATVYGDVYGGSALGSVNASDANTTTVTLDAGTIHGGLYGGGLGNATYAATVNGGVTVTVNNGSADNVFGCNNINGAPQRTVAVNIAGGNVGNAYGGGNAAAYTGSPAVSVTGGTAGNVFGGGLGSTATVTGNPSVGISGGTVTSNVYGGGSEAQVAGSTAVTISGGTVNNNVFGGGNLAVVTKSVSVSITGGTVMNDVYGGGALADTNTENWDTSGSTWAAGKTSSSNTTTVILTGGTVGNVYGGALGQHAVGTVGDSGYTAAIEPKVYGDITVTINNEDGTGTARFMRAYETHDYEGTYKDANNEEHTQITTGNVYTKGCVFGANNKEGTPKGDIHVTINSTTPDEGKSHKYGTYEIQNVYGGGNLSAYEPAAGKATHVDIHGCNRTSIQFVFGGGNAAAVPETNVTIYGDYEIETVFGGGNGSEPYWSRAEEKWIECPGASVGTSNVTLKGGYIHSAFGGSYERGTVEHINLDKSGTGGECKLRVTDVFGGGKDADVTEDINITISDCAGFGGLVDDNPDITEIKNVYAGSYNARIFGSITMTVTSGVFTNVFGGNHTSGFINGPITINIEETEKCEPIIIDNLFGGGNYAAYPGLGANNPDPKITINVKAATRIGNIYGGSNRADVDADTEININMIKGWWAGRTYTSDEESLTIPSAIGTIGNIYGGGNEGNVDGNTIVNIGTQAEIELISTPQADSETGAVPAHMVPKANGKFDVLGANIIGDVFGGCNKGVVSGNTEVNICAVKGAEILAGDPPAGTGKYEYSPISSTVASGVTIAGSADYRGVFGGGKEGDVESDSYVRLYGGSVNQSVYGGGCDADVKGDTYVTMAGGYVYDGVYGGGLHGSVGTFTNSTAVTDYGHTTHDGCIGKPTARTSGGTCTVVISGGQVGPTEIANESAMNDGVDVGFVFGAGRGEVADPSTNPDIHFLTYVNETDVTISGGIIMASVYGGGENGRVLANTHVTISGGQIGCGVGKVSGGNPVPYTSEQWAAAETAVKNGTGIDAIAVQMPECSHWDYGNDTNSDGIKDEFLSFDPYADESFYETSYGRASTTPTDGKTYYGCVFGGGSGYYPYVKDGDSGHDWLWSAGVVEGNTVVDITGGHILTNVYGGNEYTDVRGSCTVNFGGTATLGVPRTLAQIAAHPVTCYLFGAGKGDPRSHFNSKTNVGSVEVNVTGGVIYGSVFGGGEEGHVLGDANVVIGNSSDHTGPHIGTWGTSYVDGNVFGGGRGFSGEALTAGVVCGNVNLDVYGGTMLGSVYGGGRLAAVGTYLVPSDEGKYGTLIPDGKEQVFGGEDITVAGRKHGRIVTNISGGTIGGGTAGSSPSDDPYFNTKYSGNVYGGCMGRTTLLDGNFNEHWPLLALAGYSTVNITGGTIKRNVYGGGEYGTLRMNSSVTLGGSGDAETGVFTHEDGDAGVVEGDIFGGGYGSEDNTHSTSFQSGEGTSYTFTPMQFAGSVGRRSYVNIKGGQVGNCVYGGGELASVGVIDYVTTTNAAHTHSDPSTGFALSWPYEFTYMTGYESDGNTYVTVDGGCIGTIGEGDVYGGGKGVAGDRFDYASCANVHNTDVKIQYASTPDADDVVQLYDSPDEGEYNKDRVMKDAISYSWIAGSVYGGGENGHVIGNTDITMSGGLVGHSIYGGGKGKDKYVQSLETAVDGTSYSARGYSITAGKVYGNTSISMTGGHVVRNIYGGGNIASVGKGNYAGGADDIYPAGYGEKIAGNLWASATTPDPAHPNAPGKDNAYYFLSSGIATVNVTGGIVGYAKSEKDNLPTGNVFGGSRGQAAAEVMGLNVNPDFYMGYVNETRVTIGTAGALSSSPRIYGSVYGGGQDGHVRRETSVTVNNGEIGIPYTNANHTLLGTDDLDNLHWRHRGNIYGGGSGIGKYKLDYNGDGDNVDVTDDYSEKGYSSSAGSVTHSATVNINGGTIHRNVYGGGSLASVVPPSIVSVADGIYSETSPSIGKGKVSVNTVNIAGRVGSPTDYNANYGGNVFGAGRGETGTGIDNSYFAVTTGTKVNVLTGAHIMNNVYGGGERGDVVKNTNVQLTGGIVEHDAYGGGKGVKANLDGTGGVPADVGGNATIELNKGVASSAKGCVVERVFGCNDMNGSPKGHVLVHVYSTQHKNTTHIASAEGGKYEQFSNISGYSVTDFSDLTSLALDKGYLTESETEAFKNAITSAIGDEAKEAALKEYEKAVERKELEYFAGSSILNINVSEYTSILDNASATADQKQKALENMRRAVANAKYDVVAVYGGGNLAAYLPTDPTPSTPLNDTEEYAEVIIDGCHLTSIRQVYGGGNAAPTPANLLSVYGTYEIDELFGGGNGKDPNKLNGKCYGNPGANVGYYDFMEYVTTDTDVSANGNGSTANPYVAHLKSNAATLEQRNANYRYGSGTATTNVIGGRIHYVYGGSNEKGNIRQEAKSVYETTTDCAVIIDESYGAGKNADIDGEVRVEMECVDYMAQFFGGSTNADVRSDVNLKITNGHFGAVYGGNNTKGHIYGSINVEIKEEGCKPIFIGSLYGGGLGVNAPYSIYGYYNTNVKDEDNEDIYAPRTKAKFEADRAAALSGVDQTNEEAVKEALIEAGLYDYPKADPVISVVSATKIGNIYGGGNAALVIGSPHINVNMEKGRVAAKFVDESFAKSGGAGDGKFTVGSHSVTEEGNTYIYYVEGYEDVEGSSHGNAILRTGSIGNIYGGGNMTMVDGDTHVEIGTGSHHNAEGEEEAISPYRDLAYITGSVYGGGNVADVTGNTYVSMGKGAMVADRIFGGGNLGNVGTISNRTDLPDGHSSHADCLGGGVPTAFAANTGKCTVTVTGGRVGPFNIDDNLVATPTPLAMPDDYGYVFGASRGAVADPATDPDIDYKTFVDNTEVIVKNGYVAGHEDEAAYVTKPLIAGGVYGGSENGRVLHDTKVYIQGGQIGIGEGMTTAFNAGSRASEAYTDEEWAYDITADDTKFLAECAHWPYGSDTDGDRKNDTYAPYDPNAQSDGTYSNGESAQGGRPTGSDGHTFYGNVFGGGSGYFPYVDSNGQSQWLWSAGEVKGNTYLTITGGHILTSIYGGNEMTNVKGDSYVTMVGGTLGVPRTLSQIADHPVTCYLFGGGKGDPRIFFNEQTNVANATVHISDDARIYGSVFGGGEDGHVLGDAKMSIGSSTLPTAVADDPVLSALTLTGKKKVGGREYPYIGTWGTSYVEGNVFGGGRGFSGEALTAGSVGGNVALDISGGTMLGSIYGGGRMAAVGINFEMPTLANGDPNPHYGLLKDETGEDGDPTYGHVTVNISGGTIGNDLEFEPVPRNITTEAALNTWKAKNHIPNTDFYLGKDDDDADLYLLHHTKGGNVFGGSMGRNTHLDGTVNTLWPKLAVVKLTEVTISGNANIKGNVYGGGELGVVRNKATVKVEGGTIQGDVYGGGYGSDDDSAGSEVTITAGGYNDIPTTYYKFTPMIWNGCVSGNTYVNVSGGWVKKSVYGGGEMASVGLINFNVNSPGAAYNYITKHDDLTNSFALSWPYKVGYIAAAPLDAASVDGGAVGGKATVNVTGGRIGITGKDYTGPATIGGAAVSEDEMKARRTDNGDIYGGSKGIPENDRYRTAFSANVKETEITVNYTTSSATPSNYKTGVSVSTKSADEYDCIAGSVYGGGEDGHVMEDSRVTLTNGLIGHAIYGGGKGKTEFATKLLKIGATAVSGDGNSIEDYNESDTYDAYVYGFISGRVLGNTHVSMSGGYVVRNIYGGGNMASVGKGNYAGGPDDYFTLGYGELTGTENLWDGVDDNSKAFLGSGKTNVTVTGGQVGYIDSDPAKSVKDGLPYGNIFGGCRGESEPNINAIPPFLYTPTSYVGYANETDVTIGTSGSSAGPRIYGSVYGGGQDGHVRRDSYVKVYSGEIGIPYTEANRSLVGTSSLPLSEELDNQQWMHRGNVYGSGSGIGKFKYDFNYDGDTDDEGEQDYSQSSGSVTRFAQVDIFGGTIHRNVYGGGSQASVGPPPNGSYDAYRKGDTEEGHGPGKQSQTTVNISGTVGSPTGYNVVYGGEVYGASRGNIALPITFSTSVWTNVHIKNGAVVKGNVYGGGDAGAVLKDTNVEIGGE